jgi:hypothetical protein
MLHHVSEADKITKEAGKEGKGQESGLADDLNAGKSLQTSL